MVGYSFVRREEDVELLQAELQKRRPWPAAQGHRLVAGITARPKPRREYALSGAFWLSNRGFASFDAVIEHCCQAWNKLVVQRNAFQRAKSGRAHVLLSRS